MDHFWLIIYIILWALILFYYIRRDKRFDAIILILCTYVGYSIASFFEYNISYPDYKGLSLFPFLFQIVMILIALRPVSQYCSSEGFSIKVQNNKILSLFLAFWTICSLYSLLVALPELKSGIFMILTDVAAGQEIYDDTMAGASEIGNGTSLGNMPIVFSNVFADVATLLAFYHISHNKVNKYYVLLLIIALIAPFFQAIASSQRGPAIDRLYTIAITYMLLRSFFSDKLKRYARIGAIVISSFLVISLAAITISRFGQQSDDSAIESVYSYVGMENLNFNLYAFDNNGLRYGDRTAPVFKRMLGFDNVPHNFMERRKKYPHLKIDDGVFIGFVGDFMLDYGPIISFLLFAIFSGVFCKKTRIYNNSIKLHQLILIQFAACVCMCGGMKLFSFADLGNLKIIAVVLSYLLFKYLGIKKAVVCPDKYDIGKEIVIKE